MSDFLNRCEAQAAAGKPLTEAQERALLLMMLREPVDNSWQRRLDAKMSDAAARGTR